MIRRMQSSRVFRLLCLLQGIRRQNIVMQLIKCCDDVVGRNIGLTYRR